MGCYPVIAYAIWPAASRLSSNTPGIISFFQRRQACSACAQEAVQSLEAIAADYDHQCTLARALAEEYFDGRKVLKPILEMALA
jgi:hypothetical protein